MSTRNFAEVIRRKLAGDLDLAEAVESERFSANVAEEIYNARIQAGMTQQQLADRVGTHQSAIARLEDSDYDGHSLKMLERIASALGVRIEVRFVKKASQAHSTATKTFSVETFIADEGWSDYPAITTSSPSLDQSLKRNGASIVA